MEPQAAQWRVPPLEALTRMKDLHATVGRISAGPSTGSPDPGGGRGTRWPKLTKL